MNIDRSQGKRITKQKKKYIRDYGHEMSFEIELVGLNQGI